MKISTFMSVTNPARNSYPYLQAIASHLIFSDEFILIDGGSTDGSIDEIRSKFPSVQIVYHPWPQGKGNWTWEHFANVWNLGYSLCTGDWVFAGECDHVFEPEQADKVRDAINTHGRSQRVLFIDKWVSSTWDRWHNKSKFFYALNKGQYKNLGYGIDLTYKGGQDLANPIEVKGTYFYNGGYSIPEGRLLTAEDGHNMGVHFLNYDKTFQTKEQISLMRESANWAWNNSQLVKLGLMPSWADIDVADDVVKRMRARYERSSVTRTIEQQPEMMRELLSNLKPEQLGYNLFGNI